jgi:flagellar basal-body rod modification protein FlgD
MDVTQATATASPAATGGTSGQVSSGKAQISSDFETFLKMLTTQMQNQDPLNPLDSTDFATQLATFSGVEQQVKTNGLLESLGSQLNLMGLSQLAGWVGREARVDGPAAYSGTPVTLYPDLPAGADAANLVVTSAGGQEVFRGGFPVNAGTVAWDGTDTAGKPVPSGAYDFRIEATAQGDPVAVPPPQHYASITEARVKDGQTVLVLEGGLEVAASEVLGLRESG